MKIYYQTSKKANKIEDNASGKPGLNLTPNGHWERLDAVDIAGLNKKVAEVKAKVDAGEMSPLAYHMEKNIMDVGMLGQYIDIPKRKVTRHLEPEGFSELGLDMLKKYAEVFDITVEELQKTEWN